MISRKAGMELHTYTILIVAVMLISSCIVKQPERQAKFIASEQTHGVQFNLLIRKVDEPHWTIGYRYATECLPEERQNGKELEETITTVLQAWLQPLRELKPARPITANFRYQLQPDFKGGWFDDPIGLKKVDTRITFECRQGISFAINGRVSPPDLYIRRGTKVTPLLINSLAHELGHAFGLGDTYLHDIFVSTGGLEATVGTQPPSRMSGLLEISEDDRRGLLWLYKRFHENLDLEDCFFPDYVFEESPRGCIPKYPLIFEVKHRHSKYAIQMLDEDPKLDVNAKDASGFTALHYAVIYEQEEVVAQLLAHKDIKPFLRDKRGRSALVLAREAKLDRMIALLLKHPLTLSVDAKDKHPTTWGEMKKGKR